MNFFFDKTYRKRSKTERVNITIEFHIFEIVEVQNFSFNKQFWFFETIFPNEDTHKQKQKYEDHHCLLHIRTSLDYLEWPFPVKKSKIEYRRWILHLWISLDITLKFCLFELLWVPNFTLYNFEFCDKFAHNLPLYL